jgi:hypothetical protein
MNREPLRAYHLAAVALAIAWAVMTVLPGLERPVSFDGGYAYLPMARRLLAEGAAYLQRADSLATGIVAFAWPALLGADERLVRIANVVLYAATIALAFWSVASAHSNRAGVLAAFLVALSPAIALYIPDVMTEPPFFFLIAVWIASIAAVIRGHVVAGAAVGAIAFALATFTRPATTWFPLFAAAFFAWRAYRGRGAGRRVDTGLALMHVAAAMLIAGFIVRNAVQFGYPAVATGAGNALFQGVNALVDGFDPTYYGLTYDDGAATRGGFHLSIEGDRILNGTALEELRATPMPRVLGMWARKALAFVFVAAQDWNVAVLRTWRVVLVVFAVAAVAWQGRSRLVMALALFAGYLVAAHAPLFYLHRYSMALDPVLALLAAIGFAEAAATPARLATCAVACALAVGIALATLAGAGPRSPHPERSPYEVAWTHGPISFQAVPGAALEIPVTGAPRVNPAAQLVLAMRASITPERHGSCGALRFLYKGMADKDYDPRRAVRVPVRADGRTHEITLGAYAPLRLSQEGTLRIEFECDSAAAAEIGTMAILEPMRASYYRDRYLERLRKHRTAAPAREE